MTANDENNHRRRNPSPASEPPSQAHPHPASEAPRGDSPSSDDEARGSEALRGIVRRNQASRTYEEDDETSSGGARYRDEDDRSRFRRRHYGSHG